MCGTSSLGFYCNWISTFLQLVFGSYDKASNLVCLSVSFCRSISHLVVESVVWHLHGVAKLFKYSLLFAPVHSYPTVEFSNLQLLGVYLNSYFLNCGCIDGPG